MVYGMIPWHKRIDKKDIAPIGAKMHHTHMVDCYLPMIEYALKSPDKEMLLAYIEGAFAHFALDRIAHAYIFYRTGFDEAGELHNFFKLSHGFFEALLDKQLTKRKGIRIRPSNAIRGNESRIAKVSAMYQACCPYHLEKDSFLKAYHDYIAAMNLIQTRTGWIRPFLRLIMGKYSQAYAQAMPGRIGKYAYVDPENLQKKEWCDPATGEKRNESIDEIFALAKADMVTLKALLKKAEQGEDIKEELTAWERNLDHDGTPYGQEKRFYQLVWKKGENEI